MVNPYQSMALSGSNTKRCRLGVALLFACILGYGCDEPRTSECVTDACLVDASMDVSNSRDVLPDRDDMRPFDAQPSDAQPDSTMPRPSGCVHCHRNADGSGILNAHPFGTAALSCIDCHGGNPEEYEDPERAHVQMPAELGPDLPISCNSEALADAFENRYCETNADCFDYACDRSTNRCRKCMPGLCKNGLMCSDEGLCCLDYRGIRHLSTDQLDRLPDELMQFINPGDHRVAHIGCGSSNNKAGETGCHQDVVESARLSVMETFTGHYNLSRFLAGMQTRRAVVGTVDRTSPITADEDENVLRTEQIAALRGPSVTPEEDFESSVMDTYLVQQCPYCHTASFGKNDASRNYRSSGCTACHILYNSEGTSSTTDPTAVDGRLNETGHPITHQLTTAIPTEQCEHCHFQGARIGLTYQGVREGGFAEPADEKAKHRVWLSDTATTHNRPAGFYYESETQENDFKTPPDIHCRNPADGEMLADGECKMDCADCHTTRAVHGDGKMYSTAKGQVDVLCTDCHGTVRSRAAPDVDGVFKTTNGTALDQLEVDAQGDVYLTTKRRGLRLKVTQIAELVEERCQGEARAQNQFFCDSMAPDERDVSHTDSMECWTCHTQWRMNCFGCHVTFNDSNPSARRKNHQTGQYVSAVANADRQFFDIDMIIMGMNQRGKMDTVCPSMQFFWSRTVGRGRDQTRPIETEPRIAADGRVGFGWMPNFQHTTNRGGMACSRCHLLEDGSNLAQVRETFGYGNPSKQYWVAARTGNPRREAGYLCGLDSHEPCPDGMACLNPCPTNAQCDDPSTADSLDGASPFNRRCATICRSNADCDQGASCVRKLPSDALDGPAVELLAPDEDPNLTGLCVFDLTKMVDENGDALSPNAHEDTGPVPLEMYRRARDTTVQY